MKDKELMEMVFNSIKKLGCSTKKEITIDVVDTAEELGLITKDFIVAIRNIGFRMTRLQNLKMIVTSKPNACDCGKCGAGDLRTARDSVWSVA
tara:strand:+ start:453 stop:731 length:279 start_codon:yes stop_codon:yes gene_type:complete